MPGHDMAITGPACGASRTFRFHVIFIAPPIGGGVKQLVAWGAMALQGSRK